jgi:hypothetical protein
MKILCGKNSSFQGGNSSGLFRKLTAEELADEKSHLEELNSAYLKSLTPEQWEQHNKEQKEAKEYFGKQ